MAGLPAASLLKQHLPGAHPHRAPAMGAGPRARAATALTYLLRIASAFSWPVAGLRSGVSLEIPGSQLCFQAQSPYWQDSFLCLRVPCSLLAASRGGSQPLKVTYIPRLMAPIFKKARRFVSLCCCLLEEATCSTVTVRPIQAACLLQWHVAMWPDPG